MAEHHGFTNPNRNGQPVSNHGVTNHDLQQPLLDAFRELKIAFDELQAGEEELRRENDRLATTHQQAVTERQRYRDLFRFAPDAYVVSDRAGIIEDANQAATQLLNSKTIDLTGIPLLMFVVEEDRRRFQRHLTDVQQADEAAHTVVRMLPFQHDPVDVELTSIRDGDGRTIRWIIRDVSEQRRAEQEIRSLNELLETRVTERTVQMKRALTSERHARHEAEQAHQNVEFLAEASRIFSGSLDEDDTLERIVQFAVPYLADLCKIDLVDEEGVFHREAIAHEDPAIVETLFDRARRYPVHISELGEKHPVVQVFRTDEPLILPDLTDPAVGSSFQRPGRSEVVRRLNLQSEMVVPLSVEGGAGGVITFASANEERAYGPNELVLAQELARLASQALGNAWLYEEAASVAEERQRILSVASHELTNILTIISGFAGTIDDHIEQGMIAGDHAHSLMKEMNSGIERLQYLVDDLSIASTIQRHRLEINPEPLNLSELLHQVADHSQYSPSRTEQHQIVVDVPETICGEWDAEMLTRAFSNITLNALKYSPNGGTVRISAQVDGEQVAVSISDQGIGIPAADKQRLFEAFTRSENARNTTSGTGLGLYITREIVDLHGGRISLDSVLGHGTIVTIRLPLSSAAPSESDTESPTTVQV